MYYIGILEEKIKNNKRGLVMIDVFPVKIHLIYISIVDHFFFFVFS